MTADRDVELPEGIESTLLPDGLKRGFHSLDVRVKEARLFALAIAAADGAGDGRAGAAVANVLAGRLERISNRLRKVRRFTEAKWSGNNVAWAGFVKEAAAMGARSAPTSAEPKPPAAEGASS